MWGGLVVQPSCRALVTASIGIIVFKIDRRSHIPGQDGKAGVTGRRNIEASANRAFEATGTQSFPFRGDVWPPPRSLKYKVIWKNSIYTLGSRGRGDQQRAG